ncbi:hypothetical protein HID58_062005, partial [Brassica napus]
MGIALPQFILNLNGESGGLLFLFTVGLCILLPLVVASIYLWRSSKYTGNYIKLQTRQAYYELMKPSLATSKVMDISSKQLSTQRFQSAELLIHIQLTRESSVLSPSLQSDFRRVLVFAPRLLEDLMKMAVIPHNEQGHGWLSPALGVIELSQCTLQAVPLSARKSTSEDTAPLIAGYALVKF